MWLIKVQTVSVIVLLLEIPPDAATYMKFVFIPFRVYKGVEVECQTDLGKSGEGFVLST